MARSLTGDGEEYTEADDFAAEAAAEAAWAEWSDGADALSDAITGGGQSGGTREGRGDGEPTALDVSADVEWGGEQRGARTTTLSGLHLDEFRASTRRAAAAMAKARAARPAASYRAVGWRAQLRHLESTSAGREALRGAGFEASARSRRRWRAGAGSPSKERQAQIREGYGAARNRPVTEAYKRAAIASKELTSTLTDTIRDAYGTTVRLHNVTQIHIRRR